MPAFLFSRLAGPIAAGVAALLLALSVVLGVHLRDAKRDLAAANTRASSAEFDLASARTSNTMLEGSIARQNEALAQMTADAAAREAERVKADAAIDAGLAKVVGALATAKPGADKCASASDLIREFAK